MEQNRDESELAREKDRLEQELVYQRQLGFALGLFQEDVTIRALLQSLAQGVIIIDKYRNILLINASAERMFGYKGSQIIGKPHDLLLPERYQDTHREHMTRYFDSPRARPMGIGLELFGRRSDGSEFPVEISLSYVNTKNGLLVISLISDITIRRRTEEELREHAEELAEANRNLESFSYSVSHDLKAPLRILTSFSDFLLEEYRDKIDSTGKNYLNRIRGNADKMNELIDDMLDLSRISRQEVVRREVNMSAMAESILKELDANAKERTARTIVRENVRAFADERLMNVVLTNLLGNAWKFTARVSDPYIEFGMEERNGEKVYFVRDNGAGFDSTRAQDLFIPFKRLHKNSEFAGTGIGLAIVQRVIKRHGGKVWARGEIGKGATFFFTTGEKAGL